MRGTELTKDAPSIKAAILAKLIAAPELSAIKKWLKAEPVPTRYPTSPFGWLVGLNFNPTNQLDGKSLMGKRLEFRLYTRFNIQV